MAEANTTVDVEALSALPDTDDLPSANPQINKFNGAAKGPGGRFVSTKPKLETPNTDTPPATPAEPLPAPETEVATPAPAPAAAPKLDPMLQAMADRLGVPMHMRGGDPEEFRKNLELAWKLAQQQGQVAPAQAKAPEPDEDFDLGIADDEFDPKIVAALKTLKAKTLEARKENKTLKEQNQQFVQQQEQFRRQQETAQFDALCAKHPEVFGAGSYGDLDPHSIEATRRGMLYQQVNNYFQGKPWVNIDETFKYFSQVFGVAGKAAPTPPPAPKAPAVDPNNRITPQQWEAAGLLPASTRNGTQKPLSRYERMIQEEVAKRMLNGQAAGLSVLDDNSDLPKHPG